MHMAIPNGPGEGWLLLTDANLEGKIVLRAITGRGEADYRPWDLICREEVSGISVSAAMVVQSWACERSQSKEGIEAARRFLRQWPLGPQAEHEDIQAAHAYWNEMEAAAGEIAERSPPLDEMSVDELCQAIRKMAMRLGQFETESPHARLLRLRISAAAILIQKDFGR